MGALQTLGRAKLEAGSATIAVIKVARWPASKLPLVHKRFADSSGGFRSDRFPETRGHNYALFRLRCRMLRDHPDLSTTFEVRAS